MSPWTGNDITRSSVKFFGRRLLALLGCDFFVEAICEPYVRVERRECEWPVKVFNSSVENRVEKLCCESKTAENVGLMQFAQVVCSFYCSQKILARGV
jgi:hypothetical protein